MSARMNQHTATRASKSNAIKSNAGKRQRKRAEKAGKCVMGSQCAAWEQVRTADCSPWEKVVGGGDARRKEKKRKTREPEWGFMNLGSQVTGLLRVMEVTGRRKHAPSVAEKAGTRSKLAHFGSEAHAVPSSSNSFGTVSGNEGKVRKFSKHIEGRNSNEAAADEQNGRSRTPQF